ncbi:MAG: MBL fold metallo-hydrolase, partial [Synergistales bacterium]|nr:MBL fold metallo-hydrolase [Synergistales bacterium]
MEYNLTVTEIAEGLTCIRGAVNTYALTVDGETLLFDCGPGSAALVPGKVAAVYLTSHDRTGCAGLYDLPGVPVYASEGTGKLIGNAEAVWAQNEGVRYHMVDFDPQKNLPCADIKTAGTVADGDVLSWKGWTVTAVCTPGFSKHDMSYFLTSGGRTWCVCGKLLYRGGRIGELWLLQQGHDAQVCGYHGFMEGLPALRRSLGKIGTAGALLPARGEPEEDPAGAVKKFLENSDAYMRLYSEVSALNFYFPDYLGRNTDFRPAFRAKQLPLPDFIRYIPGTTSFAVLSEDGAAFVADCSMPGVLRYLDSLTAAGETGSVAFCWVSHYHHDHVEELNALREKYGCPVYADESFAGILREPRNYYLTCLSEKAADVTPVRSQTQMRWHEFTLTFYHFPGQTLYHGGLLLEGKDLKVFFSGDSFAPTGFDDYCAWNRNFLREDAGYFRCLDLLKKIKPDMILNQHQAEGFVYNPGQA